MIRRGFISAILFASLATSGIAQTNVTLNMQVGGKTRNCVVHVPTGTTKPPLVFFIHGANGSGAGLQSETKANTTADREKFIAAFPSATSNGATGTWDDMMGTGNFPFFLAVIDTLAARYQIDRNRIYMTGFSQGGFISFQAGCMFSDVFAAIAPVSGHVSTTTCAIKRPVPVFMTFGASEGAASFLKDLDLWLKLDKCPSTSTIVRPYPASNPNSKAVRVGYGPCESGSSVVMDSIQGQGHQWPSTNNLNQADEVWNFFKQYSLTGTTAVHEQNIVLGRVSFSLDYSAGMLRLGGIGEEARVRITDTKGRLIANSAASRREFDLQGQPGGIYLVSVTGSAGSLARKFLIP
ncbi:MAG: PHB depolymerase family esterase [Fibrobacteria bacterium]